MGHLQDQKLNIIIFPKPCLRFRDVLFSVRSSLQCHIGNIGVERGMIAPLCQAFYQKKNFLRKIFPPQDHLLLPLHVYRQLWKDQIRVHFLPLE